MIRQMFNVEHYWEVVVYYDVDFNLFSAVEKDLFYFNIPLRVQRRLYNMLKYNDAKAITCSNPEEHVSIVLFNKHSSRKDYINSIVHEAEHIKQVMLKAYKVEDKDEPPAYTIGYLVARMWEVFKNII